MDEKENAEVLPYPVVIALSAREAVQLAAIRKERGYAAKTDKERLAELEHLQDLCRPAAEYMREHFTPNDVLVIDCYQARILTGAMSVPFKTKF